VGETSTETVGVCHWVGGQALLPPQFVKVTHRQLQYIGLLQFADVFPFGLQC
jgi:hypothetical protein